MKYLHKTLTTLAALALSGTAFAATEVQIRYVNETPNGVSVDVKQSDETQAGRMLFDTKGGKSFYAYCVELGQYTSGSYSGYTVGSFGGAQAKHLQGLFSATSLYTGAAKIDTAFEFAAFQVAVWEITHESAGKPLDVLQYGFGKTSSRDRTDEWNVTSGSKGDFYVQTFDGKDYTERGSQTAAFAQLANSYLSAAEGYHGADLFKISKLSNRYYQDLVTAAPVPEPTSYALMMAGLLAVGLASKRRRQAKA